MEGLESTVNVIAEVKSLDLPKGEYVVFAGGLLAALGIRTTSDVDLLVSPELFNNLRNSGWEELEMEIAGRKRRKVARGIFEAFSDFWGEDGKDVDITPWIKNAQDIDGVAFTSFDDFITIKRLMNRERDVKDIELLKKYLAER
jgi:hypothetical protein